MPGMREVRKAYKITVSKPERKRSVFGRPGHRQDYKVKRNSP
jgi:ribosomal protein L21